MTSDYVTVFDNVTLQRARIIHYYQPSFQPASPGAAGYGGVPGPASCYVLLWNSNNTLSIQSINNLVVL